MAFKLDQSLVLACGSHYTHFVLNLLAYFMLAYLQCLHAGFNSTYICEECVCLAKTAGLPASHPLRKNVRDHSPRQQKLCQRKTRKKACSDHRAWAVCRAYHRKMLLFAEGLNGAMFSRNGLILALIKCLTRFRLEGSARNTPTHSP